MYKKFRNMRSWRIFKLLRFAVRLVRYGLLNEDRQKLVQVLRNCYHSLPLPASVKSLARLICHSVYRIFWFKINRQWKFKQFHAPAIRPLAQQHDKPDYVFWGVIDWHFRHQRPQQLALALATTGRRIFYITLVMVDDERAGFEVEALDASGHLFQIKLFIKGEPSIYSDVPNLEIITQLRKSIGEVLEWSDSKQIISLVYHSFWYKAASVLPNSRLVYDCIDYHQGFSNNNKNFIQLEKKLLSDAQLTISASSWLDEANTPYAKYRALIPNACEYEHFAKVPDSIYRDSQGRRVIGYFGAIADWFDLDLVEFVARQHKDCSVLLIGADTVNAKSRLSELHNVTFKGEVPYSELPHYLHGFDVCLLPFKVIPLTLATSPVKIYEYLCSGKPVVTVNLPEIAQFKELVYSADSKDDFSAAINNVLSQPEPETLIEKRKTFAAGQTWQHRVKALIQNAESAERDSKVSVIVVTYNNIELNRACLESLDKYSQYDPMEIIVVDNASNDGTQAFLSEWVTNGKNRRLILNEYNRGFSAANNQGFSIANGDYLVMLNNDTHVTPGWVRTLVRHLERDKTIGLIGPVTNNIGNEAKIDIVYDGMNQMQLKSSAYTRRHIGKTYPLRTAAFFCVMMPRTTFELVGTLDETFGLGFFEDDDYCRRVEQRGLRIVCAEDVFIHHHLSASFNKLKKRERKKLFEDNKKIYEVKWGKWIPHKSRNHESSAESQSEIVTDVFASQKYIAGHCVICGNDSQFFYKDVALWRESLNCQHCRSTSRYRSIARGLLRAINELTGLKVLSLATLPRTGNKQLNIYDTQIPFYYQHCAYPLPDLLKVTGWINVKLSLFKTERKLGEVISQGVTNQNLECLTLPDASLDIVITSDVMEHVRLDDRAHREIYRVLKPGGIYLFTVTNDRSLEKNLIRVQVTDPNDSSKDVYLLELEYHGDANSDDGRGVLAYRKYGKELEVFLTSLGFEVRYEREDIPSNGILNTELYYCRKTVC